MLSVKFYELAGVNYCMEFRNEVRSEVYNRISPFACTTLNTRQDKRETSQVSNRVSNGLTLRP